MITKPTIMSVSVLVKERILALFTPRDPAPDPIRRLLLILEIPNANNKDTIRCAELITKPMKMVVIFKLPRPIFNTLELAN
jgi:hypothetical protein